MEFLFNILGEAFIPLMGAILYKILFPKSFKRCVYYAAKRINESPLLSEIQLVSMVYPFRCALLVVVAMIPIVLALIALIKVF